MILQQLYTSNNGSVSKALLELTGGQTIETVLIKHLDHYTVCLSSQVGCPLGCVFCATGQSGFVRNLAVDEITDQINFWNKRLALDLKRVRNLVFMGMGEPFLNWENVKAAMIFITSPDGLNIGQRHISVSTCGIVDKIREFTALKTQINLAISLHSAQNETRNLLMPINRQYPLNDLIEAGLDYVQRTSRKLFFEYILLKDINDTNREINQLIKLIQRHYLFHLNLIPYNQTLGDFKPTGSERRRQIIQFLQKNKLRFTVRKSFGGGIKAACGQLRSNG
ncbi:MAG: 23S rRNA (adenine(2503)-C(2))-methyltransferase RlmN [Candidatus Schekmanbacteria bacterium]|nr:23S rRNA (adenine(2503)-C(2))-methyltransferase RlmN [Candidatus Schekmanbacteria bacterium]